MARFSFITVLFVSLISLSLATPNNYYNKKEIVVKSPQKIQEAINRAEKGTTIIVEKGEYPEQLVIKKSGIKIVGKNGAKVVAPTTYTTNECSGFAGNEEDANGQQTNVVTQVGICVLGDVTFATTFVTEHLEVTVKKFIENVEITGLQVSGFNGINIAVIGAKNADVNKNKLILGGRYGFLTVESINTLAEKNHITYPLTGRLGFIGLCMDDKSDVHVLNNDISGYFIGLCVQTNGADVRGNHVSQTCIGAFVDPNIDGAVLKWNHIRDSNPICKTFPRPVGVGILVSGAQNTEVRWNYVKNITNRPDLPQGSGLGIGVIDNVYEDPSIPTVIANGNKVRDNFLKNNEYDIVIGSAGTGNVGKKNFCTNGFPDGVCIPGYPVGGD